MTGQKTVESTGGGPLSRLAAAVEEHAVPIYSTLAAVLFATNGLWFAFRLPLLGVMAIIAAIALFFLGMRGTVLSAREARRQLARSREREAALAANQEALSEYITYLIETLYNEKLQFTQTERISVFEHNDTGLTLVARFSTNTDYGRLTRKTFSHSFGIIAAAVRSEAGEAMELKLPNPEKDWDAYAKEQHTRWKLPKSFIKGMSMHSREYAAFVVRRTNNNQISGVIVFESTNTGRLEPDGLRKVVKGREVTVVGNLLGYIAFGAIPAAEI